MLMVNKTLFLSLVLTLGLALPTAAQEHQPGSGLKASLRGGVVAGAEIEDTETRTTVWQEGFKVEYQDDFSISLEYGAKHFVWENPGDAPFGNGQDDPWHDLHSLGLQAGYSGSFNERTGFSLILGVDSGFEKEMADSFSPSLFAGLRYSLSPEWMIMAGPVVSLTPYGEIQFMGLIQLIYNSSDVPGLSAVFGIPETSISYAVTPALTLKAFASLDNGTYRLANDSTVQEKGYLETFTVLTGLGLEWTPAQGTTLGLSGVYHVYSVYSLYEDDGEKLKEYESFGGLGGYASLSYTF